MALIGRDIAGAGNGLGGGFAPKATPTSIHDPFSTGARQFVSAAQAPLLAQLKAIQSGNDARTAQRMAAVKGFTAAILDQLSGLPGQTLADFKREQDQQLAASQGAAESLAVANPNTRNQALLDAINAPAVQRQNIQDLNNNLFSGGGALLRGLGGTVPVNQMSANEFNALAFANTLPFVAAQQGQVGLANVLAKADSDRQKLDDLRIQAAAQVPALLAQFARANKPPKPPKPTTLQHFTVNGRAFSFDPTTGKTRPLTPQRPPKQPNRQHFVVDGQVFSYDPKTDTVRPLTGPRRGKPIIVGSNATGRAFIDPNTGKLTPLPGRFGRPTQRMQGKEKQIIVGSSATGKALFDPNTGKLTPLPGRFGRPTPKKAAGFSPAQITKFKQEAANATENAYFGFTDSKSGETHSPITYQEALSRMLARGIPLPIAQKSLNRLFKVGEIQKGAKRATAGPTGPRPSVPFQQRTPKAQAPARGQGSNTAFSFANPLAGSPKIIGTPFQGSHSRAFNQAGGSANWESENAYDIAVPVGSPVFAVRDGTIGPQFGSLGEDGRFAGERLHLVTPGNEFYYAHLSSVAPGIRPGVAVKAGQLLGFSGSANGVAHLHFASKNGDPLNMSSGLV